MRERERIRDGREKRRGERETQREKAEEGNIKVNVDDYRAAIIDHQVEH